MITLDKFIQINNLEINDYIDLEIISIINNITIEEVEEMRNKDIINIIKLYKQTISTSKLKDFILINDKKYFLRKNEDLDFGEFIDLQKYIQDIDNWNKVINIYYGIDLNDSYNVDIINVNGIIQHFITFDNFIKSNYSIIFDYSGEIEDDEDELQFKHPNSRFEDLKKQEDSNNQQKFGWLPIIFELAKNDITKMNDVVKQNVILVFNTLVMVKVLKITINPISSSLNGI